jgi:hypothetical protein
VPAGGAVVLEDGAVVVAGAVVVDLGGVVEPAGGIFGSVVDDAAFALPRTSPWCFDQKRAIRQNAIQIEAVMIVMRVKISPAFAPNALDPPMPPRAPASPPPRPRCTSTSRIRKIAKNDNRKASSALMII